MLDQTEKTEAKQIGADDRKKKADARTTAGTGSETESQADAERARITAEMKEQARPAWWGLLVLTGISTVLLTVFGWSTKSWAVGLVELLLGSTALSAGAFFGFLFGIPRPPADDGDKSIYRPSTNLEQVSDWLTKILIGVGLVQLAALRDGLASVGTLVSGTVTPIPPGAALMSQLVVVVFLVIGFLSSFLWTRLYYGRIQALTDRSVEGDIDRIRRELERKQEKIEEETKKSLNALARESAAEGAAPTPGVPAALGFAVNANAPAPLPPDIQEKIDKVMKAPRVWDSDPNARLFPGAPREQNGRRLDAEIASDLGDGLLINLKVVRVNGPPLVAETLFLLHPTIAKRIHRIIPRGDIAETSFYSAGAFTAVTITDNGRTVLAFDLKDLPGASQRFRES